MGVVAGFRDMAAVMRRALAGIASGQGEHHRPRSREGTHPDRNSCVRNAETPPGSSPAVRVVAGGLTVRDADRSGGRRMTKKLMPAAERRRKPIAADQPSN